MRHHLRELGTNALVAGSALLLALGCADTLMPGGNDPMDRPGPMWDGEGIPPVSGNFTNDVSDGVVSTVVDATDRNVWFHLDMDTGTQVDVTEGWELGYSRFRVRINGGITGNGGVRVAALEGQAFEDVTQAPMDGWTVPGPDGEDGADEPDNVFNDGEGDWYDYDISTHTLSAREDVTYVVASTEGAFFKLAFIDYYDGAGSPAFVSFRWAAIIGPDGGLPDAGPPLDFDGGMPTEVDSGLQPVPDDAIEVNSGNGTDWVYLSVAANGVVDVSDPENDSSWDVAFRRTNVRTNSGTSGSGLGGARLDESGTAYEDVTETHTFGFSVDEVIQTGQPGVEPTSLNPVARSWFDYTPPGIVDAGNRLYIIRRGDGGYAKLRVWRWNDGIMQLSLQPLERSMQTRTLEIDASDPEAWAYVSLRGGAVVEEVEDAATDGSWDIAISETRFRTNGGTSGGGEGAALEVELDSLAGLGEAPSGAYVEDEEMIGGDLDPGNYDGNPALAAWYTYDEESEAVAPRPVSYVIQTADGQLGALRVVSYDAGVVTLEIAFAGPGQSRFF